MPNSPPPAGDLCSRHEGPRAVRRGIAEEDLRRRLLDDPPFRQEQDPVGDVAGEVHLVGDDEHGHAVGGKLAHDPQHLAHQFRIERRGGGYRAS